MWTPKGTEHDMCGQGDGEVRKEDGGGDESVKKTVWGEACIAQIPCCVTEACLTRMLCDRVLGVCVWTI